MTTYILVTAIVLFLLGMIWNKDDWFNFACKVTLFVLSFWGVLLWLTASGYVLKM